mmetsp:Transcript_34906/g.103546  ORF Transcript_34906/g.103546 Transcript_34906/m.103546 type:complete len:494 (+) Transcript_34906:592-2073(+)
MSSRAPSLRPRIGCSRGHPSSRAYPSKTARRPSSNAPRTSSEARSRPAVSSASPGYTRHPTGTAAPCSSGHAGGPTRTSSSTSCTATPATQSSSLRRASGLTRNPRSSRQTYSTPPLARLPTSRPRRVSSSSGRTARREAPQRRRRLARWPRSGSRRRHRQAASGSVSSHRTTTTSCAWRWTPRATTRRRGRRHHSRSPKASRARPPSASGTCTRCRSLPRWSTQRQRTSRPTRSRACRRSASRKTGGSSSRCAATRTTRSSFGSGGRVSCSIGRTRARARRRAFLVSSGTQSRSVRVPSRPSCLTSARLAPSTSSFGKSARHRRSQSSSASGRRTRAPSSTRTIRREPSPTTASTSRMSCVSSSCRTVALSRACSLATCTCGRPLARQISTRAPLSPPTSPSRARRFGPGSTCASSGASPSRHQRRGGLRAGHTHTTSRSLSCGPAGAPRARSTCSRAAATERSRCGRSRRGSPSTTALAASRESPSAPPSR